MVFPNACGWIPTPGRAGGFGLSPIILKPACPYWEALQHCPNWKLTNPFQTPLEPSNLSSKRPPALTDTCYNLANSGFSLFLFFFFFFLPL